ncbi:hypothetical protein A3A69_02130 [candidate division WWE3 bacterium RIFCSPLOWO2_01_FULL_37_15]|uniref:Glycogen debranching enzyme C-terminal domain-containing protein n=1 Tax=candidate division WWE3 bacterium RIFCSPLOWO2_01_FULL_37_15 TaxID=1802622 RepID=A0A1F4USR7_UNCKA|nr:MAG: hypothetical protein A3A69_02130 [candidate division WWE3 bacterium RIFCSPLOWO2_01_FULL_37_15]
MIKESIIKAYNIAIKELRECYDVRGIIAGRHHYVDYWTRDAGFALPAALEIGDTKIVENHLTMLMAYQKRNGHIPFLIRQTFPILNFLGIKLKTKLFPCYRSHKLLFLSEVIDSNAYFVISTVKYLQQSKSKSLFNEYKASLEIALLWYTDKLDKKNNLIKEGFLAGWNDGVYKSGVVFITNLLVYKAVKDYILLCKTFDILVINEIEQLYSFLKSNINDIFWNGKYFDDWVDHKRQHFFDTNANLLSIIWQFTNKDQAEKIIDYVRGNVIVKNFLKTVYPQYPNKRKEILNRLAGMGDYWGGGILFWPEPVLLYAISLIKLNRIYDATEILDNFSKIILEFNGIFEIYKLKENFFPMKTRIYLAEHPYARGAGLFIQAASELNKALKN